MGSFTLEQFILLLPRELLDLTVSINRDDWQTELSLFLHATGNLTGLRHLSLPATGGVWTPPKFTLQDDLFKAPNGDIRGRVHYFHLPATPGEAQMKLSYEWFWSEFFAFLRSKGIWADDIGNQWRAISPVTKEFSAPQEWSNFWQEIAAHDYLAKTLEIFLNHKSLFKNQARAWDSKTIPILSRDVAEYLCNYYEKGRMRKRLFKEKSLTEASADLRRIMEKNDYAVVAFPQTNSLEYLPGGDFPATKGKKNNPIRCLACGEVVSKKQSYTRSALFLKDADERPQSGRDKDQKSKFCTRCVATVFLAPIKLTAETLVVKFREPHPVRTSWKKPTELELRKFVAHSLHIPAGEFVSLHIEESTGKNNLCQFLGARHYALWKTAVTFSPELFAQGFSVEVYPGEEKFTVPCWATWWISALADWNQVLHYRCYKEKELRPRFAKFLRLTLNNKVFQAFYTLISGDKPLVECQYIRSWKNYKLQDIWSELEIVLHKEKPMPIPDYPRIVGMAGLLLPLAKRVEFEKKNDSKRAIGKLLEEVDRPIQFAYTAARESGSEQFLFYKDSRYRYFFEKALELLAWAGEDVENLLREGDRLAEKFTWAQEYEQKIVVGPDQIARVTAALVSEREKPYANEAQWRTFAYQVKLALWSMFPQYLGSKEEQRRSL